MLTAILAPCNGLHTRSAVAFASYVICYSACNTWWSWLWWWQKTRNEVCMQVRLVNCLQSPNQYIELGSCWPCIVIQFKITNIDYEAGTCSFNHNLMVSSIGILVLCTVDAVLTNGPKICLCSKNIIQYCKWWQAGQGVKNNARQCAQSNCTWRGSRSQHYTLYVKAMLM